AGRELAAFEPARRDDGDAIDVRTAGLDLDIQTLGSVIPELLGNDFAYLVIAGEPAELQIDRRLAGGLRQRVERQQAATEADAAQTCRRLEQRAAAEIARLCHFHRVSQGKSIEASPKEGIEGHGISTRCRPTRTRSCAGRGDLARIKFLSVLTAGIRLGFYPDRRRGIRTFTSASATARFPGCESRRPPHKL